MADKIPIDWKKVDQLLIAGCTGLEVAAELGCHEDTLYNRVKEEFNMTFSAYSAGKRSKGNAMLRAKRFGNAMSGNITCLLKLCELRIDPHDLEELMINNKINDLSILMKQIEAAQSALNTANTTIKAD